MQLHLSSSQNNSQPKDNTMLNISGGGNMRVGLLAVDRAVYFLRDERSLTRHKVERFSLCVCLSIVCVCVWDRVCVCLCVCDVCMCMHVYMCVCQCVLACVVCVCMCGYVCVYVCVRVCMCVLCV